MRALVCIALCIVVAMAQNPVIGGDFTANITVSVGPSLSYSGYIVSHVSGNRWYRWVKELNESIYMFREDGTTVVYTYTIDSSGCACSVARSALIPNAFAGLATAVKSTKACLNGTAGTLYENNMLKKLPAVAKSNFCVSGTTPGYIQDNDRLTAFSNFVAGIPKSFPTDPIAKIQDECNMRCI